jgi:4'-phosphopantetheinyl transferase
MDKFPVDVWAVSLVQPTPSHLSEDEEARAKRFKFEDDRLRWTRARNSLRLILSRYAGEDPGRISFAYGAHGKPSLQPYSDVEFNLSHAGEWALIAVTRGVPAGIDIEEMRVRVDMAALLRRLGEKDLPQANAGLYQRWACREAKSKAAGGALFDRPAENICAVPLQAPENYVAAVALAGYEPEVRYCAGGNR